MSRRILILCAVLAAQLLLIALLFWPRVTSATAGPLFPDLNPDEITSVTLIWEDQTLALTKQGDQWTLPAAGDFPVNELSVTSLLTKVVQIDTGRLVADTATSHARLRVGEEDAIRRVEMTTADGESFTLFVGSAPTARATHVRAVGSDRVYLTNALSTADVRTDEAAWINTIYLETDPEAVASLTLENAQGSFALERDSSGAWTAAGLAEGESVNAENADLLSSRLASLSMIKPLGVELKPEHGLEPPTATVTLELTPTIVTTDSTDTTGTAAAPESITIAIGALDNTNNSYAVKASTSDYVVSVVAATLEPFVTFGRADLIAAPAITDTATLTGTGAITPTFSFTTTAP